MLLLRNAGLKDTYLSCSHLRYHYRTIVSGCTFLVLVSSRWDQEYWIIMKQDMMWDKLVCPCRFLLIMSIHSGIPSGLAESEGTEDVVVLGE